MAYLENKEKNIYLKLNLLNNDLIDIELNRDDYENWVPFELLLSVEGEQYRYSVEDGATFTVFELNSLISSIENIISRKMCNENFESYEFCCLEVYFSMLIYDTFEENDIYIDFWVNMGALTKGNTYGYNRGYRFVVDLNIFNQFANELKEQLNNLVKTIT